MYAIKVKAIGYCITLNVQKKKDELTIILINKGREKKGGVQLDEQCCS
jgi:hypothetical protein